MFAAGLVDRLGVLGLAVAMMLSGFGIPGLSEVMLPLVGVALKDGHQMPVGVVLAAFVGQMMGVTAAYFLARYAGVAVLERYGRYLFITHRELARSQRAFDRHGAPLVLVGAFTPGVQGLVGYVAGLAELSFRRFLVYVAVGKLIWILGLIGLGYAVGSNLPLIGYYLHRAGVVVLVAAIVAVIWYIRRQSKRGGRNAPTP